MGTSKNQIISLVLSFLKINFAFLLQNFKTRRFQTFFMTVKLRNVVQEAVNYPVQKQ
jgi:hypothetical protein